MNAGPGASHVADLISRARAWALDDPDPMARAEMLALVESAQGADPAARAELADRCSGLLAFGTAGLRAPLGAGPHRMNTAVVLRAAAGLMGYLQDIRGTAEPRVVVGFDARRGSPRFAHDTAAVVEGAGGHALLLPCPTPTPVLAWAIRAVHADAGVMVTASHNPAADNGYKVYLGDGRQIVPPADGAIRARLEAIRSVRDVPLAETGWETLDPTVLDGYVREVAASAGDGPPVRVAYTALHGVGATTLRATFAAAGLPPPIPVPEQDEPDPDFPTVPFPNPEEPGVTDLLLDLVRREGPDLAVALDPDADRCAVAVPDPAAKTARDPRGWRMLTGDELGALLAWDIACRETAPYHLMGDSAFARSVVSSRLIDAIARAAGRSCVETLTGFKWITRVPRLRYGYEEAIGYCVAPHVVADKDGVATALVAARLVGRLTAEGRTVPDVLDELALAHGVHATAAFSVRVDDLALMGAVMVRLRADAPNRTLLAGIPVMRIDDLAVPPAGQLPPTDGLRYLLADASRVIVRPSGTEPKLKVYLEAIVATPATADRLPAARAEAARRLRTLRAAMRDLTRLP